MPDSGATGHFLVEGAPVKNTQISINPIRIKLPNGRYIKSTHTCSLDISWLPDTITGAHIVLGLSQSCLISTRTFCDVECTLFFDKYECRVYFKRKLVLSGGRDEPTELWKLPINPISSQNHPKTFGGKPRTSTQTTTTSNACSQLFVHLTVQTKLTEIHESIILQHPISTLH